MTKRTKAPTYPKYLNLSELTGTINLIQLDRLISEMVELYLIEPGTHEHTPILERKAELTQTLQRYLPNWKASVRNSLIWDLEPGVYFAAVPWAIELL